MDISAILNFRGELHACVSEQEKAFSRALKSIADWHTITEKQKELIRSVENAFRQYLIIMNSFIDTLPLEDCFDPIFSKSIDELELTVRSANCLRSEGIYYIGELVKRTYNEIRRIPNFCQRSMREVNGVLADRALCLGMNLDGWVAPKRGV